MTRLTNALKQDIVNNALTKAGVDTQRTKLKAERAALAEDIRIDSLGGPEAAAAIAKLTAKVMKLIAPHRDAFATDLAEESDHIYVNINGQGHYFSFINLDTGSNSYRPCTKSRHIIKRGNPLLTRFEKLQIEGRALTKLTDEVRSSVYAAMSQATTVKKLLQLWPEAIELIPLIATPPSTLPMVQTKQLNSMIGLPSAA